MASSRSGAFGAGRTGTGAGRTQSDAGTERTPAQGYAYLIGATLLSRRDNDIDAPRGGANATTGRTTR